MTILDIKNLKCIDLTHTLSPNIPHWSGSCGFSLKSVCDYSDSTQGTAFRVQSIEMSAGIGTHMDAPAHCIPGGADIARLPIEQLIASCVVIDVSAKAHESYQIIADDIQDFEEKYGDISKNSFVIFRTGWDQFWNAPEKYRNHLRFPTISAQAAEWLLLREIVGLGIDTLSPDNGADGFPVHELILGAGKYIVENVANAGLIPPVGAYTVALPIKIGKGTEAPIRLVAMVPGLLVV